ncbi:alpha/beta hydrolase [Rhodoblastus sp.]|uniref:alpha/beta hydrolase n=1 Tax=Rhodoblastus sp. TaxID=1962975 RepID=UPI003F9A1CE8
MQNSFKLARAAAAGLVLVLTPVFGGPALAGDGFNLAGLFGGQPEQRAITTSIFIASTRKGGDHPTQLTPGAKARYALDFISVPPDHQPGRIERPAFGGPNPDHHFMLREQSELEPNEFGEQLAAQLSGRVGMNRDVLVYVHGFNTSLDDARFRLAQIVVDTHFGGVAALFTWPSKSQLLAYGADKEAAMASRAALRNLLQTIAATPGVGRIQIVAHSMGTWLTMEALDEAALSGSPDLHGKLGNVMLAAPDIDLSVFREQIATLDPSHFSVYVSKDDRALQISAGLQGDRRLGSLDPGSDQDRELIEKLGVGVYDISDLSTTLIGHDIYADAPQVIRQIGKRIEKPRPADADVQSVIDAGADRTPHPAPNQIDSQALPAPAASAPTAVAGVTPAAPAVPAAAAVK